MSEITMEQVQAFRAGCCKREPDCLDNQGFEPCSECAKVLLEIADQVLNRRAVDMEALAKEIDEKSEYASDAATDGYDCGIAKGLQIAAAIVREWGKK